MGEKGKETWQGSKGKEKPVHKAIGAILGKNTAWVFLGRIQKRKLGSGDIVWR